MHEGFNKSWLGYLFVGYTIVLAAGVFWLSSYPWPEGSQTAQASAPKPDFRAITDIAERKQAFFDYLAPHIETQNTRILKERSALQRIAHEWRQRGALGARNRASMEKLSRKYEVEATSTAATIATLERRVNIIPKALALAQAASESAWGKSRFAREGNNYFGQWCFSQGCGLVPKRRPPGATHEVAVFEDAGASVAAYFANINTFYAYRELRQKRLQLSRQEAPITAAALLPTLTNYSERGADYLRDLQAIIQQNNLE